MVGREFYVVIEKYGDGFFVGEVPQLKCCYTQSKTLDERMTNIKEVIEMCLEDAVTAKSQNSSASIR